MAVVKYKKDGEWVAISNYTVQPIVPVQTTGESTTEIMSQKAVTDELNLKANKSETYTKTEVDNTFLTQSGATNTYATKQEVSVIEENVENITNMIPTGGGSTTIITNDNFNDYITGDTTIQEIQGDITNIEGDITNIEGSANTINNKVDKINTELGFSSSNEYEPSSSNSIISGASSVTDAINKVADAVTNIELAQIVTALPTQDINDNIIYLVATKGDTEGQNIYSEYIHINGNWEKLGEFKADVDLSDYVTNTELTNQLRNYVTTTALNNTLSGYATTSVTNQLRTDLNTVSGKVNSVSGEVTTIKNQLGSATGQIVTVNNINNLVSGTPTITAITNNINQIKAYQVNGHAISGNPVLNGADIKLNGFAVASSRTAITATDTTSAAFGKVQKYLNDLVSATGSLNSSVTSLTSATGTLQTNINNTNAHTINGLRLDTNPTLNGGHIRLNGFAVAGSRTAIGTGDTTSAAFGKVQKYLNDLVSATGTIQTNINSTNAHTINTKRLDSNPTLNGGDIKLNGFSVAGSRQDVATGDTVSGAFGKVQRFLNELESATGSINSNLSTVSGRVNTVSGNVSTISGNVNTLLSDYNRNTGHTSTSSLANVSTAKRLVIATVSGNQSFSLSGNSLADGREVYIIVHNTSGNDITVTMPSTGNYVNVSGDTLTVKARSYGDISVLSDGTNKYIRFL